MNERGEKPQWLVRVPRGDGRAAGAGVLVDQHHVVTCAHVVAYQFGEPAPTAGTGPAPEDVVTVEFPFTSGGTPVRREARVVGWQPIAENQSGDAVILQLAEHVILTPAPLAFPMFLQGHRFSVHGFPHGQNAARQAGGRIGGASGPTGEWVQLDADGVGWEVVQGFSGAPVFDHDAGAVVGIVVMTDARRSGHMLPMSALRSWWPGLLGRSADHASWTAHWLPRARGSERQFDTDDWYFTGRVAARQRVCDWLDDPSEPALVVTGGPGTGKSALLAYLLVSSDPVWAGAVPTDGPRPPKGAIDVAVHVSGLSLEDVVRQVADAVGMDVTTAPELLAAMRQRRQAGQAPVVMVADAVEEAASFEDAKQIAALLRNLAGTGAVRVLAGVRTAPVGTRRAEILGAFGTTIPCLRLESPEFQRDDDVTDYVRRRLIAEDSQGHYRDRSPEDLETVSRTVASRAGYNFLIAQLTTLWLTQATTSPLDLADPAWESSLPETVGEAMDGYLRACDVDPDLVRRILTALAFARGSGLPLGSCWLTITDALHPAHTHTLADLEAVFHSTANYLIERVNDRGDQPTYRLYHHALDEHLRHYCTTYTPQRHPQRAITRALIEALPSHQDGRDWAAADAYTRTHLAGHAADARQLDDLIHDPGFLVHAQPGPLLSALPHTRTEQGRLTATVYRLSEHQHRHTRPADRCRALALDAARLGARDLHRRLNTIYEDLAESPLAWRVRFATGNTLPTAIIATLTGHTAAVWEVVVADLDGVPIAATRSSDGTVRVWDLTEQRAIGDPLTGHTHGVYAMALGELNGQAIAVTGGADGTVRVWDLTEQRPIGHPLIGHHGTVPAVAVTELDGRAVAVTGNGDGTVLVWDLAERRVIGNPLTGHTGMATAVAVTQLGDRPIAVTTGWDKTVRIWDLTNQCAIGDPLTGHTDRVSSVALTQLNGSLIAITTSWDHTVRMWDLTGQCAMDGPLTGDSSGVDTVLVTDLGGRPIAITRGGHKPMRMWDLARQCAIGPLLPGQTGSVTAVAVADLDGRAIAVTGGVDGTVRIWDLTAQRTAIGNPLTGHASGIDVVAVTELDGRAAAVTGGVDGTVRIWDLAEQRAIGDSLTGHTGGVSSVAVTQLDGRPVAVTGGDDGTVRIWDLAEQRAIGNPLTGHQDTVYAVAVTQLDGRQVAVTRSGDGTVRIWDLAGQHAIGNPLTGHTNRLESVAVAELHGRAIAVTGGDDGTVRIWDLTEQRAIGDPLTGHQNGVHAVTVAELDDRSIAITSGWDKTVRIWDLTEQRAIGDPLTGHQNGVEVVEVTELDGRPVAVTGDLDGTVWIWDLTHQHAIGDLQTGHGNGIPLMAVAELDGRPIAITSNRDIIGGRPDNTVRTWDLKTQRCFDELPMPGPVKSLTLGVGVLVVSFGNDIAAFDTTAS